eukprot:TRINITY_DN249_c1_g1_i6.p1 TRINITY_DN249_c1_g1~~TRINITY_DN249_c1_g1_i6.p1  ORF type:complete len:671 (+),score=168.86 TRINITY_DN249_c1_g1_i6:348-2360(+)
MQANSSRQKPYATMLEVIVHSMAFGSTALSTSPSAQTSTPSSTPASPTPTKVHQQKLEHRNSEQQAAMAVPESPKLKPRQAITAVTELVQKATKEEPPAAQTQTTSGTPTQVVSPRKEVTRATSGKLRRTPSHTLSPAHTPTLLTPVEEITATPIPPEMGTQTSAVKQTPLPEVAPKPPRPSSLPALQKRVSPLSAEISPDLTAFEHGKECTRKSVTFRKETLMLAKKKERKSNTTAPKSAFRKKKVHEMVEEKLGDKDARAEEEEIKKSEVEQRLEEEKVKAPEKENQREKEEKEKQAEEQKTEAHEAALAGVKEQAREKWKPAATVTAEMAQQLITLVFGSEGKQKMFPDSWFQGFFFCDEPDDLRFGLLQSKGGPCVVLACVQAFTLRALLFTSKHRGAERSDLCADDAVRQDALLDALCELLWRIGEQRQVTVALPPTETWDKVPCKIGELRLYTHAAYASLLSFMRDHFFLFQERNGNGVALFVLSAVLTRGIERTASDMDTSGTALMGKWGYACQELVNLLLTGKATSNVFNGDTRLEDDDSATVLHGVSEQCEIGYLTDMETSGNLEVGSNLKNSLLPIWVIYSESHYTVLFALQQLPLQPSEPFDLYYYDQLANAGELYRLAVDTDKPRKPPRDNIVPPLESCIATKWGLCQVDWNGADPLL